MQRPVSDMFPPKSEQSLKVKFPSIKPNISYSYISCINNYNYVLL